MKKTSLILIIGLLIGFFLRDLLMEKPVAAKVVTIKSRNLEYLVETHAKTVEELLDEQQFDLSRPSATLPLPGEGVVAGMIIRIQPQIQLTVIDGGAERTYITTAATVGDFLYEEKIGLAQTDKLQPAANTYLTDETQIQIDRIVDIEIEETIETPYEIIRVNDPAVPYGVELPVSAGKPGRKLQKFMVTYKNGVEIKRKLLAQQVLEKPVIEIRKFGTMIKIEETTEGRASWYSYKGCNCAAHPFYEFGRYVRVTSLATGKSIIIKINDRGPDLSAHPERVIDLDVEAFRQLAPLGAGTIGVKVELIQN